MSIAVVIPNYNRGREVCALLESLQNQTVSPEVCIVVDDCSTDDSPDAISRKFPEVHIERLASNAGPSSARHCGYTLVRSDIIIGLDSDVLVKDPGLFEKLEALFAQRKEIACIAFRIINENTGKDDVGRWWHPVSIIEMSEYHFETSYFSGTGFAIRKAAYDLIDGFPKDIFMFNEEVEVALQLLGKGMTIEYEPSLVVYHCVSPLARNTRIPFFAKRQNQLLAVIKYYPFLRGLFFLFPRICETFVKAVFARRLSLYFAGFINVRRAIVQRLKKRKPLPGAVWKRIEHIGNQ